MTDQVSADFKSELDYWDLELSLKGVYPDAILNRSIPERMINEFPMYLLPLIEGMTKKLGCLPRFLDVGSGPLSMLAYGAHNRLIELTAVDALADRYKQLLKKYGYKLDYALIQSPAEKLTSVFKSERFDIVWIHNALDHTQIPELALREMASVLKLGGYFICQGWSREGTAMGWCGLHQHDLYLAPGGRLICESRQSLRSAQVYIRCISDGLPLELVESSEPSEEVKKWIKMVWRKNDRCHPPIKPAPAF